jgi:hypothetical protein
LAEIKSFRGRTVNKLSGTTTGLSGIEITHHNNSDAIITLVAFGSVEGDGLPSFILTGIIFLRVHIIEKLPVFQATVAQAGFHGYDAVFACGSRFAVFAFNKEMIPFGITADEERKIGIHKNELAVL